MFVYNKANQPKEVCFNRFFLFSFRHFTNQLFLFFKKSIKISFSDAISESDSEDEYFKEDNSEFSSDTENTAAYRMLRLRIYDVCAFILNVCSRVLCELRE